MEFRTCRGEMNPSPSDIVRTASKGVKEKFGKGRERIWANNDASWGDGEGNLQSHTRTVWCGAGKGSRESMKEKRKGSLSTKGEKGLRSK